MKKFKCYLCNKLFDAEKKIFEHLKVIHNIKEHVEIECVNNPPCSKTFLTFQGLKKHLLKCVGRKIEVRKECVRIKT